MKLFHRARAEKAVSKPFHITVDQLMAAAYILLICVTVMGDSTILRRRSESIGTLSKVVSMGAIGLAALKLLVKADLGMVRRTVYYILLMITPLTFGLLWSFGIWIYNLEDIGMMTKGLLKLLYQYINAFVVISGLILFRKKALDYTFDGIVIGNGLMILLGIKEYGVGPSIQSVIDGIFGGSSESYGFMATMEINDITFALGLFLVYYILIEWREKWVWARILVAFALFVLGYKRIALLGLALGLGSGMLFLYLSRRKHTGFIIAIGFAYLVISFLYVWFVRSGLFTKVTRQFGIETMGRNNLYEIASNFYEISILFVGHGLQVLGTLMSQASNGELTAVHNDIMTFYVELGFWGFLIWFGYYYIVYTYLLAKHCTCDTVAIYMACLSYLMITYFTDNTFFYYWDSFCLRLIPLAVSFAAPVRRPPLFRRRRLARSPAD